jgi:hypothetical protein
MMQSAVAELHEVRVVVLDVISYWKLYRQFPPMQFQIRFNLLYTRAMELGCCMQIGSNTVSECKAWSLPGIVRGSRQKGVCRGTVPVDGRVRAGHDERSRTEQQKLRIRSGDGQGAD